MSTKPATARPGSGNRGRRSLRGPWYQPPLPLDVPDEAAAQPSPVPPVGGGHAHHPRLLPAGAGSSVVRLAETPTWDDPDPDDERFYYVWADQFDPEPDPDADGLDDDPDLDAVDVLDVLDPDVLDLGHVLVFLDAA